MPTNYPSHQFAYILSHVKLTKTPYRSFCQKLESELRQRINNPDFQIADICQSLLMSRTHLYRKIKQHYNSSFSELITTLRLNLSKKLLLESELSISQIAYEVGYRDPSYFVRTFKKHEGMTPRAYRCACCRGPESSSKKGQTPS